MTISSSSPRRPARNLPHLASRLLGTPLLADERKLDAIVPVLLRKINGDEPADMDPADERTPGPMTVSSGVAVIPVIGSLIRRPNWLQAYSGMTSYPQILDCFRCALDDERVRAILLQVDSFGGEGAGCFELCDEIFKARGPKPIWAIADVDALSAGYAILSSAERVYAAQTGAVGSIGVVAVHLDTSIRNEAMGLTYTVFRAGARKAELNSLEPVTKAAAEKLQTSMERLRQRFAASVARSRPGVSSRAALATEGQWYDPEDALKLKLIDGIGTFEDIFAELAAAVPPPARPAAAPPQPPAPVEGPENDGEPVDDDEGSPPPDDGQHAAAGLSEEREASMTETPAPATPAPAAPATSAADNVLQLDAARDQGRAEAMANAREIGETCLIAGKPELAAGFLADGLTVAQVRKKLIDDRADADAAPPVDNRQPQRTGTSAGSTPPAQLWDTAFKKVHAGLR